MSGLLDGKRILVTGVITDQSIGFNVARLAMEQGAQVVVTDVRSYLTVEKSTLTLTLPEPGGTFRYQAVVSNPATNIDVITECIFQHLPGIFFDFQNSF